MSRTLVTVGLVGLFIVGAHGQLQYRSWDGAIGYCVHAGNEEGLGYDGYLGEVHGTTADKSLIPYGVHCHYVNGTGSLTVFRDHGSAWGLAAGATLVTGLFARIPRRPVRGTDE